MALPQNITDPGSVNVADQAYPFPPGGHQALPPNFGRLLQASLFASPIVPPSIQAGQIPTFVPVERQVYTPPSFVMGTPAPSEEVIPLQITHLGIDGDGAPAMPFTFTGGPRVLQPGVLLLLTVNMDIALESYGIGISGGLIWDEVTSTTIAVGPRFRRMTVYRAMVNTPTSYQIVINSSNPLVSLLMSLEIVLGASRSGINGSGAIAQKTTATGTASSNTLTLGSSLGSLNKGIFTALQFTYTAGDNVSSVSSGYSVGLSYDIGAIVGRTAWKIDPGSPSVTWTLPSSRQFMTAEVEIKSAAYDVAVEQNTVIFPVRDYVVTDVANFELTQANSNITLTVTSVIDADTGIAPTSATTRYRIYVSGAVLTDLGLSITGRQVIFSGNTSAGVADYVRNIIAFNANSIIVLVTEFGEAFSPTATVTPTAGDTMTLDIERRGSEVVFDTLPITANVVIDSPPAAAVTEEALSTGFQGNYLAGSGVVAPFIGAGLNGPHFQGTVEVANQTYGRGLPGNIFP